MRRRVGGLARLRVLDSLRQSPGEVLWHSVVTWIIAAIGVLSLIVSILTPRGWDLGAYCQGVLKALRSSRGDAAEAIARLPVLGPVQAVLAAVLPSTQLQSEVRDQTLPFLQIEMQNILRRCVGLFERVVILVDDVDVLPSSQFNEFFRILRPLNKVPGVTCLVCVPRFFFEATQSENLGDLHSTVRQCEVVGLRGVFDGASRGFAMKDGVEWRKALGDQLEELLVSRVRLRMTGRMPGRLIAGSWLVQRLLSRWKSYMDSDQGDAIRRRLAVYGPSRRELLRETERMVRAGYGWVGDVSDPHSVNASLEALKTAYDDDESGLLCEVDKRKARMDAKARLNGGARRASGRKGLSSDRRAVP